jgi:hypothetical protein
MRQSKLSDYQSTDVECIECGKSFLSEHALIRHEAAMHREVYLRRPVPFRVEQGYERWYHNVDGDTVTVGVHQLFAIAEGFDPHDVFADGMNVHHGPEIEHPRATIPGNVQLMNDSEHTIHHNMGSGTPAEDLLREIDRLADELGRIPTLRDMDERGRYSKNPYYNRFGSWDSALETAGYDPQSRERHIIDTADLLTEIKRLADGSDPPRFCDMREDGVYSAWTYINRFGSWNAAVEAAGYTSRP